MSRNESDPGASTEMFRAFVENAENAGGKGKTGNAGGAHPDQARRDRTMRALLYVGLLVVGVGIAFYLLLGS